MLNINDIKIPDEFKTKEFISFLDKLSQIKDNNTNKRNKILIEIKTKIEDEIKDNKIIT